MIVTCNNSISFAHGKLSGNWCSGCSAKEVVSMGAKRLLEDKTEKPYLVGYHSNVIF